MNIALINEYFPPFAPGGAEWSMFELAKALIKSGHSVTVITPNYGAASFEKIDGIHIYRFPFPRKLTAGRKMSGFIWTANILFYLYSAFIILRIAKKESLELLHVQNKYSIVGAFIASKLLQIPFLVSVRDTSNICRIAVCLHKLESAPKDCNTWKLLSQCSEEYYKNYYSKKSIYLHAKDKLWQLYHWWDVHLRRSCLNQADAVIGVSNGILKVYEQSRVFKGSHAKKRAIYNFLDSEIKNSQQELGVIKRKYEINDWPMILYVGGFSRGKGTDNFIKAAKLSLKKNPNLQFVMIGSGNVLESVEGIRIFQDVARENILHFYLLARVVVVPSTCQESFSRVILEAMACGKPVIGTRVGGTPEQVENGVNGFVIERENPVALADAIDRVVENKDLCDQMGKESLRIFNNKFQRSIVIEQMINLYESTIKECRSLHDRQ